jgi:signal transduction histidine kinase
VFYEDDRPAVAEQLRMCLQNPNQVYRWQFRKVRKDGGLLWVEELAQAVYDLKGVLNILVVCQDITERKRAEEALRKAHEELEQRVVERTKELSEANAKLKELDRLKSMFIASMSHELRTPLNSVIGFSSTLLDEWFGPLNAEQKENLEVILKSGKHLLNLVNDVIDVSKIEAGKIEIFVEDFDIYDTISEAITPFEKDIKEKRLELKIEAVHQQMHTDRRRLLQCVLNLVSNAVKFTEKGMITVGAGLAPALKEEQPQGLSLRDLIEISVTDTGVGIRETDIPRLFTPFVRLESPLKAKVTGTGLGLYLTRKLVIEVLKGEIICKSRYEEGSTFAVRIPVRI